MATITGISLTTPRFFAKPITQGVVTQPIWMKVSYRGSNVQPLRAAPDQIQDKIKESIEKAQETCGDDPVSGECVAAWDEVEELSAAASHLRDKQKSVESDPLEVYCKDNPETDECRTYDS